MKLNLEQIKSILPHREPFLLVDEIVEFEPEKKAIGIKKVLPDDFYFQGHFPQRPVMPGVIMTEAMAQVGGIIVMQTPQAKGKLAVLSSIEKAKFRKIVEPNETLLINVEVITIRSKFGKVKGFITSQDKLVAEAEILFSLID